MSKESKLHVLMKEYESKTKTYLSGDEKLYHVLRFDGRKFSKFCKGLEKPFDKLFRDTMEETMLELCIELPGAILGYTQSDEITVIFKKTGEEPEKPKSMKDKLKKIFNEMLNKQPVNGLPWNGNTQKIISLMSSRATLTFNRILFEKYNILKEEAIEISNNGVWYDKQAAIEMYLDEISIYRDKLFKAEFDARLFSLPKEVAFECVYWRWKDCSRNAIQMIGRCNFSHRELQGVSTTKIVELLKDKDIELDTFEKRYLYGSILSKEKVIINEGTDSECIRNKWIFDRNMEDIEKIKKIL